MAPTGSNFPSPPFKARVAFCDVSSEAISIPNQMVRFDRLPGQRGCRSLIVTACAIVTIVIPPSGASRAAERTIAIARSDCELAVRYVPPPGVAYQPGVDVHGKPVAPADLDGGHRLQLPETIPVVITDDLRKRFGLPDDSPLFDSNSFVGIVGLRLSDGRLTFNGVPLVDREADALATACRD